ncbi:MAG: hypothetical protein K5771_05355 [Oscillospiraceae bacterium]|nr:hypothetical protein [Oscillospiraceae bacterium]
MAFEAWQLGLIDAAGYNGIRGEHIEAVARELEKLPQYEINTADFRSACYRAGVDPDNFDQYALASLQERLNR